MKRTVSVLAALVAAVLLSAAPAWADDTNAPGGSRPTESARALPTDAPTEEPTPDESLPVDVVEDDWTPPDMADDLCPDAVHVTDEATGEGWCEPYAPDEAPVDAPTVAVAPAPEPTPEPKPTVEVVTDNGGWGWSDARDSYTD